MQDQQVIAGLYFVEQVGGPEHADVLLATQAADVPVERQATRRVEADTGFIEQQQARLMQQGAGNFHPATMAAIEFAHPFAAALGQGLAGQFGVDPKVGLAPGQAMQCRVITQVLLDAEVQVQGALLEHHAQLPECRACRAAQ
ncbi:hypothetical protein D3C73_706850 [compost metagenome]